MYYNLDTYAGELWLTAKQFEDNLQLNYKRYEKRIIDTRVHYEKKLESVKQAAAYFIEAQNLALNSAKLNNRLLVERCEMRVNEYESALIGQSENLEKNSP